MPTECGFLCDRLARIVASYPIEQIIRSNRLLARSVTYASRGCELTLNVGEQMRQYGYEFWRTDMFYSARMPSNMPGQTFFAPASLPRDKS